MKLIDKGQIRDALAAVGVERGRVVYLQTDLTTIGMVAGTRSRDEFCQAYLDCLFDLLGPEGTLVVPTYTTQVARFDMDFIWEETPTVLGTFPEYVRQRPDSLRSLHPVVSFTAMGAQRQAICGDNGVSGFGWDSPAHRFWEADGLAVTIGLPRGYAVGIPHHIEALSTVPYMYNKLLKWEPIVAGKPIGRRFVLNVRWLHLEYTYSFRRWVDALQAEGVLRSVALGGHHVHSAPYRRSFAIATEALRADPNYLFERPLEIPCGREPFDGPTAAREPAGAPDKELSWTGYYLMARGSHDTE